LEGANPLNHRAKLLLEGEAPGFNKQFLKTLAAQWSPILAKDLMQAVGIEKEPIAVLQSRSFDLVLCSVFHAERQTAADQLFGPAFGTDDNGRIMARTHVFDDVRITKEPDIETGGEFSLIRDAAQFVVHRFGNALDVTRRCRLISENRSQKGCV